MELNLSLTVEEAKNERFWQAVQERDASYKGIFVYGVQSTGIYCNPGCPSRQPKKEKVTFYLSSEAAESAGFRPCRRCHPNELYSANEQVDLVKKALKILDEASSPYPSLEELSNEVHLSPTYLHKVFKAVLGLTPRQYMAGKRLDQFKNHVRQGADVTTAMYNAGYSSTSRLYEGVSQRMGMTPASYRQGGAGKKIFYTFTQTYLGLMLVAATQNGICAVSFGQDQDLMVKNLQGEYPAATILFDEDYLAKTVSALLKHLAGSLPHLDLPLDLQATAFQLRVWEELRKIPYGETRSYAQVAQAIGKPSAVRAVANACAANPVVVVTPCHRVIRSDGSLGGYHYGVERKKALLSKEKG